MSQPSYVLNIGGLPLDYPTHAHAASFWEALGRAVATYGFLEEVLGKAIFAFTATRSYSESEVADAYKSWLPTLQKALTDQLGNLIGSYEKAVRANEAATIENLDDLIRDLREESRLRNVLCHASWRKPDAEGRSLPFFVNNKNERFDKPFDTATLIQAQRRAAHLAYVVINTVTHMGWQFPGSTGPGQPIWTRTPERKRCPGAG